MIDRLDRDIARGRARTGAFMMSATAALCLALVLAWAFLEADPEEAVVRADPDVAGREAPGDRRLSPFPGGPDHDGDGVASGADALPFLDTEQADADGDGYGDSQDRFPEDPRRARPPELIANGGFDAGPAGWVATDGAGSAAWTTGADPGGGGALRLQASADADDPPRWTSETLRFEPGTVVLHVSGRFLAVGSAVPELRLAVRNKDPLGTSTVVRTVPLGAATAALVPGSSLRDGWRAFEGAIDLPSRPVSATLLASVSGAPGAVLFDDLAAHPELAADADGDGIDDRVDPDDDGDGLLDGEDPMPLDARTGPSARLALLRPAVP